MFEILLKAMIMKSLNRQIKSIKIIKIVYKNVEGKFNPVLVGLLVGRSIVEEEVKNTNTPHPNRYSTSSRPWGKSLSRIIN